MIRIDAKVTATDTELSKMYMNNAYYNKIVRLLEIGMTEEELMKAIHDICKINEELTNKSKVEVERLCSDNRTIWWSDYINQSEQIKQLKQENEQLISALDAWQSSR